MDLYAMQDLLRAVVIMFGLVLSVTVITVGVLTYHAMELHNPPPKDEELQ